jgi:hypothetical protein
MFFIVKMNESHDCCKIRTKCCRICEHVVHRHEKKTKMMFTGAEASATVVRDQSHTFLLFPFGETGKNLLAERLQRAMHCDVNAFTELVPEEVIRGLVPSNPFGEPLDNSIDLVARSFPEGPFRYAVGARIPTRSEHLLPSVVIFHAMDLVDKMNDMCP